MFMKITRFFAFILVLVGILTALNTVYAEGVSIPGNLRPRGLPTIDISEPDSGNNAAIYSESKVRGLLIMQFTSVLLSAAGVVSILFIVWNGYSMILAAGKEEKLTEAKKGLTWAIIGLILVILSYSIIRFIIATPFIASTE